MDGMGRHGVQRQSSSGERDCSPLSHRVGELGMAVPYVRISASQSPEKVRMFDIV